MPLPLLSDDQIRRRDIDTLKRFLRRKLGGYKVVIKDVPIGQPLFRGVICESRPTTIDRVSYPPPDRVTRLGRVNRPGSSMFYCSVAAPPVFYELRAKQGDLIAVSRWEVAEPLWMHNLGYHPDALGRMGVANTDVRTRLTDPILNETAENIRLRRQLSLAFTKDVRDGKEYIYKQSIAINELLFDDASLIPNVPNGPLSGRVAGTVYPAMQMKGAADNAAIWPEFVDSSLTIRSVGYALVEADDNAALSYTILTLAMAHKFDGQEIIWERTVAPEKERRQYINFEDGEWVIRDGRYRIIYRN